MNRSVLFSDGNICPNQFSQFAIWTPKGIKIERFERRDDNFVEICHGGKIKIFLLQLFIAEVANQKPKTNIKSASNKKQGAR